MINVLYVRQTKNLNLVGFLVMGTCTWSFFLTPKYLGCMQYCMMLQERRGHILVKTLATGKWLNDNPLHVYMLLWLDYFFAPCLKFFLPSILNSVDFWSSLSGIAKRIELPITNILKELEVFIVGVVRGHSFRPTKSTIPQKKKFGEKKLARNSVERWMFPLQRPSKHDF